MDAVSVGSCLLASVLYYGTLDAGFVYDDSRAILSNQDVLPSTPVSRLLTDDFWGTPLSHGGSHGSYRPLCVLSFRLNYLAGGFRAWGYHLVNILLHCLATGLAVRLARVLFPLGATLPAAVTGLLFAAHPIHAEAVAGVVGRADLIACVLYLLSFLCYVSHVKYRDSALRKHHKITATSPSECNRHNILYDQKQNSKLNCSYINDNHLSTKVNHAKSQNENLKTRCNKESFSFGDKCSEQCSPNGDSKNKCSLLHKRFFAFNSNVEEKCGVKSGNKWIEKSSNICLRYNKCVTCMRNSINALCDQRNDSNSKYSSQNVQHNNASELFCGVKKRDGGKCMLPKKCLKGSVLEQENGRNRIKKCQSENVCEGKGGKLREWEEKCCADSKWSRVGRYLRALWDFVSTRCDVFHQCECEIDSAKDSRSRRLKQWLCLAGCILLAAAAILSKETGITVLLVCAVYDIVIHLRHWQSKNGSGIGKFFKQKPPRGILSSLCCLAVALATLLLLRLSLLGSHTPVFATADNPASRSPSLLTRALTFIFLPVFNFYLLLFPRWLSFDWSMDAIPRITSFVDPRNFPVLAFYYTLYRTIRYAVGSQLNPPRVETENWRRLPPSTQKHRRHVVCKKSFHANNQQEFSRSCHASKSKHSTCPVCRHSLLDHHSTLCRTNNNNNTITLPGGIGCKCNCKPKISVRNDDGNVPLKGVEVLLISLSFMIIPFLPATNVLFYVGFVVAERVLYIPSVGFCLLVALGCHVLNSVTRPGSMARRLVQVSIVILIFAMAARTLRRSADWKDEESLYRSGIPINPPKAYGNLGSVFSSQGRTAEAEWAYRKALEYRSNMADVHYNLGVLLQGSERYDEAIQSFQLAIQYRPTLALAHLNLGQLYERRGRCQEAEKVYRTCSKLDGSSLKDPRTHEAARISALLHLGRLCADQGRLHEAIATYQEAVLTMPDYYPPQVLYNLLGEAYFRFRYYKHAERWFQAALRAEPTHVPAHLLYGSMLARNKSRLLEAERWFQKALELAPTDPGVHHHFGQFLSNQQRHGEAAVHYERAAELAPSELELVVSAATALRRAGLTHRAELFYRKAVLLSPQSARSHLNLGAILHVNGKYEEAAGRYREALKLQPGDVTTLTNLHKLHSLMQRQAAAA